MESQLYIPIDGETRPSTTATERSPIEPQDGRAQKSGLVDESQEEDPFYGSYSVPPKNKHTWFPFSRTAALILVGAILVVGGALLLIYLKLPSGGSIGGKEHSAQARNAYLSKDGDDVLPPSDGELRVQVVGDSPSLGMPIDIFRWSYIISAVPWPSDVIERYTIVEPHETSASGLTKQDSVESTLRTFEADASIQLKITLSSAPISFGGSASLSMLKDHRTSIHQMRYVIEALFTSGELRLDPTLLRPGHEEYALPETIAATHFVCAVEYGCRVFIVIEQMTSSQSEKESFSATIEVFAKTLGAGQNAPGFSFNGEAHMKQLEEHLQKTTKMSIRIYGDFIPPHNPMNLPDAIWTFANLTQYIRTASLREGKASRLFGIPIAATLCPLSRLSPRHERRVNARALEIVPHVTAIQKHLEHNELELATLYDYKSVCQHLGAVCRSALDLVKGLFAECKAQFTERAGYKITALLRGNATEERELLALIDDVSKSPCLAASKFNEWLEMERCEFSTVAIFLERFQAKNVPVVTTPEQLVELMRRHDEFPSKPLYVYPLGTDGVSKGDYTPERMFGSVDYRHDLVFELEAYVRNRTQPDPTRPRTPGWCSVPELEKEINHIDWLSKHFLAFTEQRKDLHYAAAPGALLGRYMPVVDPGKFAIFTNGEGWKAEVPELPPPPPVPKCTLARILHGEHCTP